LLAGAIAGSYFEIGVDDEDEITGDFIVNYIIDQVIDIFLAMAGDVRLKEESRH
jgi:hypothetical protein